MNYYAGIGSRKTPPEICDLMTRLATKLEQLGYILRSGGAEGADKAFESGVTYPTHKEIFLAKDSTPKSEEVASTIHPAWDKCSPYVKKLHGRNIFQVLGRNLDSPVEFVICWTPNSQDVGGTRTAVVLARQKGIPVYNLADEGQLNKLLGLLGGHKDAPSRA